MVAHGNPQRVPRWTRFNVNTMCKRSDQLGQDGLAACLQPSDPNGIFGTAARDACIAGSLTFDASLYESRCDRQWERVPFEIRDEGDGGATSIGPKDGPAV